MSLWRHTCRDVLHYRRLLTSKTSRIKIFNQRSQQDRSIWTDLKPSITVNPKVSLVDEELIIKASGLSHGQPVTIKAETQIGCNSEEKLVSLGCYVADETGCVFASSQPSLGGTYQGIEPLAPIWSMHPTSTRIPFGALHQDHGPDRPLKISFSLLNGHVGKNQTRDDVMAGDCDIIRGFMAGNIMRVPYREGPMEGTLYVPTDRGSQPLPAIFDFRGAEESHREHLPALLASHGYVTMTTRFPLHTDTLVNINYLEQLFHRLACHRMVDENRIGVLSRGDGVAIGLSIAAYLNHLPLQCLVGINGVTFNTNFGWILPDGTKTGFYPYYERAKSYLPTNGSVKLCSQFDPYRIASVLNTTPNCFVPVENISIPLMMFSAGDNPYLPSKYSMEELTSRLRHAGRRDQLELTEYSNTGHLLDPTYVSHIPASYGSIPNITGPANTLCSCRYILSYVAFVGLTCSFMNRASLSVAITAMVNSTYSSTYDLVNSTAELCPARSHDDQNDKEEIREGEFPWDAHTQEQILAGIYYGFPVFQVPIGIIADKYPRSCIWIIGVGYLLSTIFSLFIPLAAYTGGAPLIIALRILSGLSEGGTYPCLYSLMSRWAPPADRSKLLAIVFSGSSVGQIIAPPISGILCESDFLGGWPSTFYLFGLLSVLSCITWFLVAYSTPMTHPRISQEEKDYIMAELRLEDELPKDYPWKRFLTSLPLLAVIAADFALMWVLYSLTSNLPIFLKEALRFDISQAGILSSVPHIVFFVFIMGGGILADFLLSHTDFSLTAVRKFMTTIGILPSGIFLVLAGYVGCNATLAITFISLGLACTGLAYSGSSLTMMEFATPYAGMVVSVSNSIATFTGFISPAVVAIYTENQADIAGWRSFFWVTFGIAVVAWLIFMIFGTSELQSWAKGIQEKGPTEHRETTYGGIIHTDLECNTEGVFSPDYT